MISTELSGRWIGDVRGTVVGNIFVEFERLSDDNVNALIRVNSAGQVASLTGIAKEEAGKTVLELKADPNLSAPDTPPVTGRIAFDVVEQGRLVGGWELSDNNKGVVALGRSSADAQLSTVGSTGTNSRAPVQPLQIVGRTKILPKLTIYRDEL